MDNKAAKRLAIRELGKKEHIDDVRRKLCADGSLAWEHADDIIKEVKRKNGAAIALRQQSGLFLFLALLGFLAGLYLIIINGLLLQDMGLPMPLYDMIEGYDLPYGVAYGANNVMEFYGGAALSAFSILFFLWALSMKI
jgi:hypothetical protein